MPDLRMVKVSGHLLNGKMPEKFIKMYLEGKAEIKKMRFGKHFGTFYCYEKGCFRLIWRRDNRVVDISEANLKGLVTFDQVREYLGISYFAMKALVDYYKLDGFIKVEGDKILLNKDHPQYAWFIALAKLREKIRKQKFDLDFSYLGGWKSLF